MEEENVTITEEEKLYEASPIDMNFRQMSSANYYLDSDQSHHLKNQPYISQALHFSPLMNQNKHPSIQGREYMTSSSNNYDEESKQSELFNLIPDNISGSVSNFLCLESLQSQQNEVEQQHVQQEILPSIESVERQESIDEESLNLLSQIHHNEERNDNIFNIQDQLVVSNEDDHIDAIPDEQNIRNSHYQDQFPLEGRGNISSDQFDIYDNKNPHEKPKVSYILPNELYMKITILRSNNDLSNLNTTYFVTPRGVVNSLRTYPDGDVTIGRQYINENDLGSVHSTYLKVSKDYSHELRKGQNYQIGTDIYFNIIDLMSSNQNYSSNQMIVNTYEDFMMYIAREYQSQTKIYGIEKHEYAKFLNQKKFKHSKDNKEESKTIGPVVQIPKPYSLVKFEIVTSGGTSNHLLVSRTENQRIEYKLGRAATCDIITNQITISREQCRFVFNDSMDDSSVILDQKRKFTWGIRDGNDQRESANGTWVCLTDYRLRQFKQESQMEPIRQGSEIKLSDTVFKIDWTDHQHQKL
ncbi:UNKNOWN [Stylonychia lemnae]|uniref:FHA domain-containing protein n=1 Tax=Stylonychia lemnae TaxID=5949 RepID=A0A078AZQ1_STYLE|nr:UNKNOWN [Stylonychia lemnae]|eukprot:CDW86677.1 UNKNOWN [Stylonychia lemnae]